MTRADRWNKAQAYERDHWRRVAQEATSKRGTLEWYGWRADRLREIAQKHAPQLKLDTARVLEIGSGPVGTISYFKAANRDAIDPLNDYYESQPALLEYRDPNVRYKNSSGETLPYEDASFSLVIIDNVIDHTQSPEQVLGEIHRVLIPNGVIYLSVNVRTSWGLKVRYLMELVEFDKGHPHSYSKCSARKLVERNGFATLHDMCESTEVARAKERQEGDFKSKVKLALGVYDILYEVLAQRTNRP